MNLNDLLFKAGLHPHQSKRVLVMRHRPKEPELRKVLRWLAADQPQVFNAYQQTQRPMQEASLQRAKFLASFIGNEPGEALFVGLYEVVGHRSMSSRENWKIRSLAELGKYGFKGPAKRKSFLWFDLEMTNIYNQWKGKLIVKWPPPERSWCRWANKNEFQVKAIAEESLLSRRMPDPDELVLSWSELAVIPKSWRSAMSQWRGIYMIFDTSDCKGYIGAAYGKENIYSRWLNYADSGHGGNKLLRKRNRNNFQFSILQLLSQTDGPEKVIRIESSWKNRLHTRQYGLNEN